ncbi:MAG: hypothetical protein GKR95_25800 [Gammaproteobacteria bacterium]|nr:hypothetical protein [Gammaproteobacteria bacterium]
MANHTIHLLDVTSLDQFFVTLASQNLIYWFACYVIIYRLLSANAHTLIPRGELITAVIVGFAIMAFSFLNYYLAVGLIGTAVSLWLLSRYRAAPALRSAGIVLLALCIHLVWAKLIFQIFQPYILLADAFAVDMAIKMFGLDIIREVTTFRHNGHAVILTRLCSSFHNISLALLIGTSAIFLVRSYWVSTDVLWLPMICFLMVFVNIVRLIILAWSYEHYEYWHHGPGTPVLAAIQTAILAFASFFAAYRGKADR